LSAGIFGIICPKAVRFQEPPFFIAGECMTCKYN
jgi:hypothetical protein